MKFAGFQDALRALARQHGVYVGPTSTGEIGVWDLPAGEEPLSAAIVDCTQQEPAVAGPLPNYFATCAEAEKHPGFIGYEMGRLQAILLRAANPRSEIVAIGSMWRITGWVVVRQENLAAPSADQFFAKPIAADP